MSLSLHITLSLEQVAALKAMGVPMTLGSAEPSQSPTKALKAVKKEKKPKDPNAPKREPSEWIKFTGRVRTVLQSYMAGMTNEKGLPRKPLPKEVTQTASILKEKGLMASCCEAQILEVFQARAAAVAAAAESATESATEDEAPASPAPNAAAPAVPGAPVKKPHKPWSEETKKAAAAKRAATKASKKMQQNLAAAAAIPLPESDEEELEEGEIRSTELTDFKPWEHKKVSYLKNARGDVVTEDMQWVGRWDGDGKIDKKAAPPSDLGL
jgi:hypothetical protein